MQSQSPKRPLYDHFATVARAIGHPHKLELLELLAQGERSVEGLANAAGLTPANASQHLRQLRRAGLAESRKQGLYVYYRLAGDDVIELLRSLRLTAERQLRGIDHAVFGYFDDRDGLEAVSREELLRRSRHGHVTVVDVRPVEEYRAGHIPGALHLPLEQVHRRLARLPREREVIAYCRGAWCVLAFEAVAALREEGFRARRLEEGFPEWKAAGLSVERTAL